MGAGDDGAIVVYVEAKRALLDGFVEVLRFSVVEHGLKLRLAVEY